VEKQKFSDNNDVLFDGLGWGGGFYMHLELSNDITIPYIVEYKMRILISKLSFLFNGFFEFSKFITVFAYSIKSNYFPPFPHFIEKPV
jgi:hypothetical protein